MLALPVSKKDYNALILVIYKFSKKITLIENKNIFTAEDWAYALLSRLDFIDSGLSRELITDQDPKFLSKFWALCF